MKSKLSYLTLILFLFITIFSSCVATKTSGNSGKLPPGQVKKITGSKSAKPYAPGQQKKHKKPRKN